MKRKLLIEESDELPKPYKPGRLDAFAEGAEEGAQKGFKVITFLLCCIIVYLLYIYISK
jgi:hypothetical protein